MDAYTRVKGKCIFWREAPNIDDEYDTSVKPLDKRVECSCFVEGRFWHATMNTIPEECPRSLHCRYYIKG